MALSIPLWGYIILQRGRNIAATAAWVLTLAYISFIHFFIKAEPLFLMFLYIVSSFLTLKILVAAKHLKEQNQLNFKQWLLFNFSWFGMNPRPFLAFPSKLLSDYTNYVRKGILRMFAGWLIINVAGWLFDKNPGMQFEFIRHLFYLAGLSLMLHFGVLNISTGLLRWQGINVTSLFKDPVRSKSLNEFWSRRWNLAFVELTTIAVLRPVKSQWGQQAAFWASFIFSGLLHEMAISLPVKNGFGKPFLYFIIQALLILIIDPWLKKQSNIFVQRFVLLLILLLPVSLLFHDHFILQVIIPLVNYLRIF